MGNRDTGARIVALCLLLVTASACCGPAAELVPVYAERTPVEIAGRYSLGRPLLSGLKLCGKAYACHDDPKATCYPTVVEDSVVRIGWDEHYIIAERHPREDAGFSTPDASNAAWSVVVVESGSVYEDLSYEGLMRVRDELSIPEIEMRDAMDVYRYK